MANRRKEGARPTDERKNERKQAKKHVPHEVLAVIFGCIGALTVLSLFSFDPLDASLNASGAAEVKNLIGPAGAYWSDLLLQALGVSAYALGIGIVLAGYRALAAKQVWPGFRETMGLLSSVVSVGAFAHLYRHGEQTAYPPGGVVGAIVGDYLRAHFATVGSYIIASALVLLSIALTADGVLAGVGLRGLIIVRDLMSRVGAAFVQMSERRRILNEKRSELVDKAAALEEAAEDDLASSWTLGEEEEAAAERRKQRLEDAQKKAQALAEAQAERELQKETRARRSKREPEPVLEAGVDLAAEEEFSLGDLPEVAPTLTADDAQLANTVALEDEDIDVPVRAAMPPPPADIIEEPAEPIEVAASAPDLETPKRVARRSKTSEPQIVDVRPKVDVDAIEKTEHVVEDDAQKSYELPPVSLLDYEATVRAPVDPQRLRDNAVKLTKTLKDYGIEGSVREIRPGPVVTMYEYVPAAGTKVSKIASLSDDIAMSMEALRVRIVAPIPGKGAVGIEIPNDTRETVFMKEIIAHDAFKKQKSNLTMALGKDIEGNAYAADLAKMPHLLVAGATGAGKSVSINTMIMSILFRSTPDEVRLLMVDPKMLELSVYDGIPHLLLPVVTDPKKAALALRWATEEMERRYALLSETGVRGIDSYNKKIRDAKERGEKVVLQPKKEGEEPRECEPLPYIVVIVDELADLMMVASREVEASIMRLAQMARAAGIHLILATQRPSVDVITGVIKANFPSRIAFQVASKHDSRTIIDGNGAEHLLGKGDMLYLSPGAGGIVRVHGAFVSDEEIQRTVNFWKDQGQPKYDESILAPRADMEGEGGGDAPEEAADEMYDQAVAIVAETRQASISMIQRRLRIGYNRAARMVERMETEGIVGPADGAKPREVLVSNMAL